MGDVVKMTGLVTTVEEPPEQMLEKAKDWGAARVLVIAETESGELMWGGSFGDAAGINWLLDLAKTDLAMRCLVKKD